MAIAEPVFITENSILPPTKIVKRDGSVVDFDSDKIDIAIAKCFMAIGKVPNVPVSELVNRVVNIVSAKSYGSTPSVDFVQDNVERVLLSYSEYEAAKKYILYRAEHEKMREERPIPEDVRLAFADAKKYFPTPIQEFMFLEHYSRFDYTKGRRETWVETVDRAVDFLYELGGDRLNRETYEFIRSNILEMNVMPSMRLLAMAGAAARRNNICIYNCAASAVDCLEVFGEALLISMCGCFGAESLIMTDRGPIEISALHNTPCNVIVDGNKYFAPLGSFISGVKQLYNVTTKNGYAIRLTEDHRLFTPDGWKELKDICVGDNIKLSTHNQSVKWDGNGSYEEGYLCGIFWGDGFWDTNTPVAVVYDKDNGHDGIMEQASSCITMIKRRSNAIGWRKHRDTHKLSLGTWLRDYGFGKGQYKIGPKGSKGKIVPLEVEQASSEFQRGFLRGAFDTDGSICINDKRRDVNLHQSDFTSLQAIQRMLSHFGIISSIKKLSEEQINVFRGKPSICRPRYKLVVSRDNVVSFANVIGFSHTQKSNDLTDAISEAKYWTASKEWSEIISIVPSSIEEVWDITVNDIHAVDANGILAHNCGFGYSVESQFIDKLPEIKRQNDVNIMIPYFIEDTTEGWVDALNHGIKCWFDGYDVQFDFSKLRPAGAVLKTKGGRSSGPDIFKYSLAAIRNKILSRQGSKLRPIDAHDIMCHIASAAVSGGVRRSAMISLFDFNDYDMLHCKDGDFERENSQRWNANNSYVYGNDIKIRDFMRQYNSMIESERGEPGMFNRDAAYNLSPQERIWSGKPILNPCVTGDTWIMTADGPMQVIDLVGRQHDTYVNGKNFLTTKDGFWSNGTKDIVRLKTDKGYSIELTENHKLEVIRGTTSSWLEVKDIKTGDMVSLNNHRGLEWESYGTFDEGWLLGNLIGDGTFSIPDNKSTTAHLDYWGETKYDMQMIANSRLSNTVTIGKNIIKVGTIIDKYDKIRLGSVGLANLAREYGILPVEKKITSKVEGASSDFYKGFIQGFFDADGTIVGDTDKGISIRLSQSRLHRLYAIQRMLLRIGIVSKVYENRRPERMKAMPDGHGGYKEYSCAANHEIIISNNNIQEFAYRIGFSDPKKSETLNWALGRYKRNPNKESFVDRVVSIEQIGTKEVFDCSVPGPNCFSANGFMSHNCGEIMLNSTGQFCNLSIIVARNEDNLLSLVSKAKSASLIGTIQSMATNFPGLRPSWKENCEAERLLGVDINGQLDCLAVQDGYTMQSLRNQVIDTNEYYADKLRINKSTSVTCVKPGGNSSQLLNCSSGIHARWAPYYIRNIRTSAHSPLCKVMRDAGVPMDAENGQTDDNADTFVIHFPVKAPDGTVTRNDRSVIDQCEYWLLNKLNWTTHNPSVTITYKPDEIIDLMKWIWDHKDVIGGMAFLPSFDDDNAYAQLPYIEITKEEYEKRIAEFPEIDFSKIYRYEFDDTTTSAQEVSCSSGQCDMQL